MSNASRFSSIPQEIKDNGHFCVWQYEEREGNKTKVPYNPNTREKARANDKSTFSSFAETINVVDNYSGLGLGIFDNIGAIDIDHCVDEASEISEMALDIVATMKSYYEYSPSGNGIRILFKVKDIDYDKSKYYINNQNLGLEIYVAGATNKYVSVTGNVIQDNGYELRNSELQIVLDTYMKRHVVDYDTNIQEQTETTFLSDEDVIEKAKKAKNGKKFSDLLDGKIGEYNSSSEADIAFCGLLAFWTGKNATQIDRIYRQSGLFRDKWNRKRSGSTYGAITIQKAIESCNDVYIPRKNKSVEIEAKDFVLTQQKNIADFHPNKNDRYQQNDIGNGNLFADYFRDVARYVPERKQWCIYNGKAWRFGSSNNGAIMEYCKSLADELMKFSLTIDNEEERRRYIDFVRKWQNRRNREIIIKDASTVYQIGLSEFDKNPSLLNCQNGTLNLKTYEFHPHNPDDYLSKLSGVHYNSDAESERWNSFIEEIMEKDMGKAYYLQKALGYALTGNTNFECFFVLFGPSTRNGKGTCMETFLRLMGDYGITMRADSLGVKLNGNSSSPSEDIARLAGTRFVNVSEPDKKLLLSSSLVKTLTGRDTINARYLNENSFDYVPQFKLFINTNYLPTVTDNTLFSSGRVKIIPFERKFEEVEQDVGLKDKLSKPENLSGILNWAIEGLKMIDKEGFEMPESVIKATQYYQIESDKIAQFFEDEMEKDPFSETLTSSAYCKYQKWCMDNGYHCENQGNFNKSVRTFAKIDRKRPKGYPQRGTTTIIIGYRLKDINANINLELISKQFNNTNK